MSIPTPPQEPTHLAGPHESQAMPDPTGPPLVPVQGGSKKHLYFGLGGLVIGLVVGLLLGAVSGAVAGSLSASNGIAGSVKTCLAEDVEGVTVMDKGRSLEMSTSGNDSTGTTITTVVCILTELEAPESLYSRIESTRALDGTQEASWDGYWASWTYHPDNGLNIIVEAAK